MGSRESGGGSLALVELIEEHGSALVADFAHHYNGLRLANVVLEWSPREVLALVEGLPDDGLLAAHRQGGDQWREFLGWGADRHMFALWLDMYAQAHTEKGKKAWTYPRPSSKPQPSQGVPFMQMFPPRRKGE